jgi:hypothetical protein
MAKLPENLSEQLQFLPRPWWDPVPWWWLREVDKSVLNQLAVVQLEHQKVVLDAQKVALDKALEVIRGTK